MTDKLKVEKLFGERLWVLTMYENTREVVDAWEATLMTYNRHMNSPERYLVYDTSAVSRMSFTGYMQQRAVALAKTNPEAAGRVALVAGIPAAVRYIIDIFVKFTNRRIQPHIEVRVFATRDDAVNWVKEILPPENLSSVR